MRPTTFAFPILLCLSIATFAPAPADAGAGASAVLYSDRVAGSAAYAARIVADASGEASVFVEACCSYTAPMGGFGVLLYDANREFRFGFFVTGGISRERTVLEVGAVPDGIEVQGAEGDAGNVRLQIRGAPHATHHVVGIGAGLSGTAFAVEGGPGARASVSRGPGLAFGDPDFADDGTNVEAQRNYRTYEGAGAKLLVGATKRVAMGSGAYGLFSSNGFKQVCQSGAGKCAAIQPQNAACASARGVPCDATGLSWRGPDGTGGSGQRGYVLTAHSPPGAYAFTVDRKADAYGPWTYYASTGTWIALGEDQTVGLLGDVALPP